MNHSNSTIDTHYLLVPYQNKKRRVRILLPKNYPTSEENFPVIYMHDGQNIFTGDETQEKGSWKVDSIIEETSDLPPMIVVAIDNDEANRTNEYAPWKIKEAPISDEVDLGGQGSEYAEFVMSVVKSFIDQHYQTKPDKTFTAMIGSSLGGTISTFMGIKYQDRIGGLGIFAAANWVTKKEFDYFIEETDLDPDQQIYIQVGTEDGDEEDEELMYGNVKQAYIDFTVRYLKQLIQAGIPVNHTRLNIFVGEEHLERDWSKHLPECLRFISRHW